MQSYSRQALAVDRRPSLGSATPRTVMRRVLGDRLVQFLVLGVLIFGVTPAGNTDRRIAMSGAALDALARADAERGTMPTEDRRAGLQQRYIEDEILYREGLRLGLDQNDGIVRQRVIQRALFLAEEMGGASREPTDAELRAHLDANPERFVLPANVSFRHVYAPTREALPPPPLGDQPIGGEPSPIGNAMTADLPRVASRMGDAFAAALLGLTPGTWSEPIESTLGWHRVFLVERREARPGRLDEVRQRVRQVFEHERRKEVVGRFLQDRFALYDVTVDGEPVAELPPSSRVALRVDPSAED